jgi:hypothetical protein
MNLTVRRTRDDGSVTFNGTFRDRIDAARRERDAWIDSGYQAEVVDGADPTVAAELRAWRKAVNSDGRWFPPVREGAER